MSPNTTSAPHFFHHSPPPGGCVPTKNNPQIPPSAPVTSDVLYELLAVSFLAVESQRTINAIVCTIPDRLWTIKSVSPTSVAAINIMHFKSPALVKLGRAIRARKIDDFARLVLFAAVLFAALEPSVGRGPAELCILAFDMRRHAGARGVVARCLETDWVVDAVGMGEVAAAVTHQPAADGGDLADAVGLASLEVGHVLCAVWRVAGDEGRGERGDCHGEDEGEAHI